VSKVNVDRFSC